MRSYVLEIVDAVEVVKVEARGLARVVVDRLGDSDDPRRSHNDSDGHRAGEQSHRGDAGPPHSAVESVGPQQEEGIGRLLQEHEIKERRQKNGQRGKDDGGVGGAPFPESEDAQRYDDHDKECHVVLAEFEHSYRRKLVGDRTNRGRQPRNTEPPQAEKNN